VVVEKFVELVRFGVFLSERSWQRVFLRMFEIPHIRAIEF
jgi:hypothetical protein